ncbi:penicillin-binding protein 1A [Methylomonas paludis]|uniref:Penicillin-binding protein 1A n=1 Tax=Methylomonas paludis TaxID=1173101 RepID=A0A975MP76_9GAMM|nr:penicillin-binding protein 1A [Methylomonas paludis]QWF70976.1 penicillin-binding protein 1A [Methylomonas paludis]
MSTRTAPIIKSLLGKLLKWLAGIILLLAGTALTACYFFVQELDKELPDIDQLAHVQYQTPLRVYSQDQQLIAEFGENRRIPLAFEQIPPQLINAFLAAEDDRFYQHNGIDIKGLLRAGSQLLATGKKRQGGSTITMQVVRNFLLSNEKTYLRKLKEIMLALKIEKRYTKPQILELYLNKIYMGQRAYGVAAAAQAYYGKEIYQLDLAQQAMIAGLPKAPSLYNPIADPERALQRRNYVLRRMLELHFIDADSYSQACAKADNAYPQTTHIELNAPYVAEMVRLEMMNRYGEEAYTQGLKVYTTINSKLQISAERALQFGLHEYDQRHGYRDLPHKNLSKSPAAFSAAQVGDTRQALITGFGDNGISARLFTGDSIVIPQANLTWTQSALKALDSKHQGWQLNDVIWVRQLDDQSWTVSQIPAAEAAFVVLNPNNGGILALTGGFDFIQSKYNRATQSKRQPGSGFKPIIYTAALENGFTPASIINDAPIIIEDPSQENDWRPENYSRHFLGPTPLRVALRESINLVSIRLLQEVGIKHAIDTALRFGFEREQLPGTLSLALGSGYATPLKMAEAYAVFANGGFAIKHFLIEHIEDHQGNLVYQAHPDTVCADCPSSNTPQPGVAPRVITTQVNFLMNSLLRDVVQRGTATSAKQLGRGDIAGKTGTTNEQRDAWFNGYAADLVASAWLGFDNSSSLGAGETGGKAALPIWIDFMKTALRDKPETALTPPEGIVAAYINPEDGLLMNPNNKNGIWEYFSRESLPTVFSGPRPQATETNSDSEVNLF